MEAAVQKEFSDFQSLASHLNGGIRLSGIVGIDGFYGAGKTTLGKHLSEKLNYAHIDLDDFLKGDAQAYVSDLKMQDIRKRIEEADGNLIISGCCLLEVFDNLKVIPNLLIYVKRISASTQWDDGDYECDELLRSEAVARDTNGSVYLLDFEIESYHRKWKPYKRAGLILNRCELH